MSDEAWSRALRATEARLREAEEHNAICLKYHNARAGLWKKLEENQARVAELEQEMAQLQAAHLRLRATSNERMDEINRFRDEIERLRAERELSDEAASRLAAP